MSFRRSLTFFFVVIVIVPMVSVAVVLFRLIDDSESGKADATVRTQQTAALNLFSDQRRQALAKMGELGDDRVLGDSLQKRNFKRAQKRAGQLVQSRGIERIVIANGSRKVVDAGDKNAIATAGRSLRTQKGAFGRLEVSVIDARTYARQMRTLTGVETVVRIAGKQVAGAVPGLGDRDLPRDGELDAGGEEYRVTTFNAAGFGGDEVRISTLRPTDSLDDDVAGSRLTAGALLLGFLIIAVLLALYISRSLQTQIASFLSVARRLGDGDFTAEVPTQGNDEFAALGEEFNKMSRQLEGRLTELRRERERVQGSMRRLGEAVASNLDRDALLEIVVRTAVEGVGADGGRASVCGPDQATLEQRSKVGSTEGLTKVLDLVEIDALVNGTPWESTVDGTSAIAHPLRSTDGSETVVGVVSVGRKGRTFTQSERELFDYLAAQAAVSMENVDLHETVARESVTDDLTGLSNRRGFDEALTREVERAKRFGDDLGLVLFDLDDFKAINDTFGHQQGDVVLREVSRVLRETSREIDATARYGGEELAIILPGTDLQGAFNLAERVRERVAALRIPLLLEEGTIRLTTSCGVSSLPVNASDEASLVAAADAALYEAKGTGKNKAVRAS